MGPTETVVRAPADLTAEWLTAALGVGDVESFTTERIGTGQMSENHRVTLSYADAGAPGPRSVVLKVAASDETSRQTGVALGLYEREVRFYAEVAPAIGGPVAPCHHASFDRDSGTFCLLLGDAGPAEQGDEVAGATLEQARLAMTELGRLHAPAIGSESLAQAEWLNRDSPINQALMSNLFTGFLERYDARIAPEHREVCERLVASFDAYLAAELAGDAVRGLVHGDYRLDNLLFGHDGADRPLTVVDWQTVTWGAAMTDVAYFLGCAMSIEDRRAHGEELLGLYYEQLGETSVTLDQCREGMRRQSFFGVMMAIISPMLVARTERGDDMFMTVLARHAQQVLDLDALTVLPEAVAQVPLLPDAADEHPHVPGEEPLWNESWYFDVADAAQGIGAYVRLGLTPNQAAGSWYTALVCGPGRPTVAVLDFALAMPGEDLAVRTERFAGTQAVEAELERYRVTLRGRGEAHDDPAALLRGESGRDVDVELDLVWETAGEPYAYRLATRYEIPCRVSGTLTVDGERIELDAAAGQRDHSWGVRDWWSMDWVWSTAHLDDGTHLHGLDLRIPETPRIGIGYTQAPGAPIAELTRVRAEETIGDAGLPLATTLTLDDVVLDVEPLGHGPLRLEAEDGRVAMFPRAWCRVTAQDGRSGVGWLEWNRNAR